MYKLTLIVLFPFLLFAQYEEDLRILETLCSEEFGGRGYVNSGDSLAAEFLAAEFKAIGVKSLSKSYFQSFDFTVNSFPENSAVTINEKKLLPGKEFLVNPASGSSSISLKTKTFYLSDFIDLSFSKEIDSIIAKQFIPVIHPANIQGRDTLQALVEIARKIASFSPVVLLKEKLSWHTSQTQSNHAIVEILTSAFQEGEIHINVVAVLKNHTARNVIAEIPAKKKAKKTIVFTAHYDHLGRMGQDTYFPGANDNASGTTMLLSLARELVQTPSDTRYIFMAFAGEEVAILGSNHFVENPTFKLSSIDFLINLDIIGGAQKNITVVNGSVYTNEFNRLVKINSAQQFVPEIKSRTPTSNSDHHWFFERGVPCFYLYTAGNNTHYHVPEDHAKDVDLESFTNVRSLLLAFVGSF